VSTQRPVTASRFFATLLVGAVAVACDAAASLSITVDAAMGTILLVPVV